MKTKLICILFFSLFFTFINAQKTAKKDSLVIKKYHYEPNFIIGVDILNLALSAFTKPKLFQVFVSSKVKDNWYGIAEAGYDKNIYTKNNYDVQASGSFLKLGAYNMLVQDPENVFNGFYAGGKFAGGFYNQEYKSVPVKGYNSASTQVIGFPKSHQSSFWLEATLGGRVQLFKSNFYIDVNVQPKYLLFTEKQENIQPMIVPGFGKSSTKFNFGFAWNIAYKF